MQRLLFPSLLCAASLAVAQLPTVDPPRGWKTAEGVAFQASIVSFDGTIATFKMPNGSRAQAPATKLSEDDQKYLVDWQKKQPISTAMPNEIGVETAQVKAKVREFWGVVRQEVIGVALPPPYFWR